MDITVEGLLGRFGRQCYAVLCLGVVLLSVTIAHYYDISDVAEEQQQQQQRPNNTSSETNLFTESNGVFFVSG